MRVCGDEVLVAWPVGSTEKAAQIERDPRTRAELFVDLAELTRELRRVRARLDWVEDENVRLRQELARIEEERDEDDVVQLVRKC